MQRLSGRLKAVADLVCQGSAIVDVGTDHGYIPVYLVENNIIKSAVAIDVNEGPLASCKALVEEKRFGDRIKTRISDGLLSVRENECDTIIIAGMGGELIARILSDCKWAKNKRLVLQPMTHPEILRKHLFDNGFEIMKDIIVPDGKHHYSVITAEYTGNFTDKEIVDYYLGNIDDFSDKEYFMHLLKYLNNKAITDKGLLPVIATVEEKL